MSIELDEAERLFKKLYSNIDGRGLSLKERDNKQLADKSFVYGEVVPAGFYQMMLSAQPQPGEVFYDFGSGTGKAVILAHLLFDFSKVKGIELLEGLYKASVEVDQRYQKEFHPKIAEKTLSQIELIHGSFLDLDIRDADFVFMNSTCFQEDLMAAVALKLEEIRPNATVISLSKSLRSPAFHEERHEMFDFSWGRATAFFHKRRLWNVYM